MGPAVVDLFEREGATVIADPRPLTDPAAPAQAVTDAGPVDVLVANLDSPAVPTRTTEIRDDEWLTAFDELVHPLMRLVRAVLPGMLERRRGKIVAITSSTPLRPLAPVGAYAAARAAQNSFVQHVGVEVAAKGVNVNAIAQNFVENPDYFPAGVMADDAMRAWIERWNPSKRIARGEESAALALFLASDDSDFFHGQVVPFAGGSV